jgi:hypothetical protein
MINPKFATAINCIDGRAQTPVRDWMRLHLNVEYIDVITEPGADRLLTQGADHVIQAIETKVRLSIQVHDCRSVAVVGHYDCRANPVSKEQHFEHIKAGVAVVKSWGLQVQVIGLWVNEYNWVDVVCDSSYLPFR